MKHLFRITLVMAIFLFGSAALPGSTAGAADPPPPVAPLFWNRLGSVDEVLDSEIGPDILLTSYKYTDWQEAKFEPAKFDNGLFVNHDTGEGGRNDGANFFAIDTTQMPLSSERGAIEFWFAFRYGTDTWNHAYFFDTRNALMSHYPDQNWTNGLGITAGWNGWNYGGYGKRFFFGIGSPTQGAVVYTPNFSANPGGSLAFVDGTLMHFAFVWDKDGIGGSADTLRIYVNDNLVGTATQQWPATLPIDPYLFIGSGPNCCSWDHHYNAVKGVTDNLIIWNYAKTDFSDRFQVGVNHAPDCTAAAPNPERLWPPNNKFVPVILGGVTDANGDTLTLAITSIRQDEPVGKGNSAPDGTGIGAATAELRAEKLGSGNGRFYHVSFTASDGHGGACQGVVRVAVSHDQAKPPVDGGPLYDSTVPTP